MDSAHSTSTIRKPFIQHVHELQMRLTWSVLALLVCGLGAYLVNDKILSVVQRPLGQTLYYTSPTGGFSFLLKLCIVTGLIMSLPIILYNVFKFLGPLLHRKHRFTIVFYTFWSFAMAGAGVAFAYFISLPAALNFLAKFGGEGIQSLITADEYFSFALAYLGGFALLFQLPLIVLFINRIKPLKPRKMMAAQRFVLLFGFIIAAVLTPTPDPANQLIMALPIVVLYQISIVLVIIINRLSSKRPAPKPIRHVNEVPSFAKPQVNLRQPKPIPQVAAAKPIVKPALIGDIMTTRNKVVSSSRPVRKVAAKTTVQAPRPAAKYQYLPANRRIFDFDILPANRAHQFSSERFV